MLQTVVHNFISPIIIILFNCCKYWIFAYSAPIVLEHCAGIMLPAGLGVGVQREEGGRGELLFEKATL